jgi:hypothetical protein
MGTGLQELCELLDTNECTYSTTTVHFLLQHAQNKRLIESAPLQSLVALLLHVIHHKDWDSSIPEGYSSMLARQIRIENKLAVLISTLAFLTLGSAFAKVACAQAVAEAAGATSVSATAASSAKATTMPKFPAAGTGSASAHLIASSAPAPEVTNRKIFEARAGKDASKLLLRATPVEAQIWVDGKIVGKTPMLLVLAPGKYEIEMRGARGQTGKHSVDLLPRETRELAIKLAQLYPGHVSTVR